MLEKSGSVVANAGVTLTNTETNQVRTASTNDRGYYSLPLLPPASYRLSIEMPGFSRFVQSDIHLNVGDALTVNPTLQMGQVSQQIT
ncbi:MAG TPA: carboxypeptidase-like regulatory domain-containing protein, partial [Edaphobacter sp.]